MREEGLSVKQIKELESRARKLGLSEEMLIENASGNMLSVIDGLKLGKRVFVVAGRGNNGADVLACARKLANRGYEVEAGILDSKPLGVQAQLQRGILQKMGVRVFSLNEGAIKGFDEFLNKYDFILEGLLGIGVKGKVSPLIKEIVSLLNQSNKTIVACDVPSGLCPDTGLSLGEAVRASYTVTFLALKKGFYLNRGPSACGKIILTDIGVSAGFLEKI